MTVSQMAKLFKKYDGEFLEDGLDLPKNTRLDLYAFNLLNELVPSADDIVGVAEHDQITLDVDISKLSKVITEEQIITLIRCGIIYDEDIDSFTMFV